MAYSTSSRYLAAEVVTWIAAATVLGYVMVNYDHLKKKLLSVAVSNAVVAPAQTRSPPPTQTFATAEPHESVVELKAQPDGHFRTDADINGRSMQVMVDTGATFVALPYEAAEHAGIFVKDSDFKYGAVTANGITRVARVTIDSITIGDITVHNVPATVHQPRVLQTILLGMSFVGKLSRFEMRDRSLFMHE